MLCLITAGRSEPATKARATRARQHMVIKVSVQACRIKKLCFPFITVLRGIGCLPVGRDETCTAQKKLISNLNLMSSRNLPFSR